MKKIDNCTDCHSYGFWAMNHRQDHLFCRCGKLGEQPPAGVRLYYRYLVETVTDETKSP